MMISNFFENMRLQRDSIKLLPESIRILGLAGAATVAAICQYADSEEVGIHQDFEVLPDGFSPWMEIDLKALEVLSGMSVPELRTGIHEIRDASAMRIDRPLDWKAEKFRVAIHVEKLTNLFYGRKE